MKTFDCLDEQGLLWRAHVNHNRGQRNEQAPTDKQRRGVMETGESTDSIALIH